MFNKQIVIHDFVYKLRFYLFRLKSLYAKLQFRVIHILHYLSFLFHVKYLTNFDLNFDLLINFGSKLILVYVL